jgi:hypothetical protein
MNSEKARDFFSAYYEDCLESGIKQAFEQRLRADATLQADYAAFVETIEHLDALRHEEIEIPSYLSDRIATRLEQVQSKQKFGLPVWATWFRNAAFAGLAVAAIAFALPMFHGNSRVSESGIAGGGTSTVDQLVFKADGGDVVLNYQPSSKQTVVVSMPLSGKEIQRFNLDGQTLQSPIQNPGPNPALFKIEVLGDKTSSLIAVPGTGTLKAKSGEGTIQDLAVSLAGHYHVPVVIEAADITHHVTWSLAAADAITAADQAVANEGFSVDQRTGGLIKILDR